MQNPSHIKHSIWMMALGALGVVFGDIGTSPLYALRECFAEEHGISLDSSNILGILSLIFWTIIVAICFKYMAVVMKADNKGEGGILSLMALASSSEQKSSTIRKYIIATLGLFGAALLYGDGVITPAISVLSAVEGLSLLTPALESYVIPVTIFILNAFFLMQRFGTGKIGVVFGPILLVWFAVLGGLGLHGIMDNMAVLEAINPLHAVEFFNRHGTHGFVVLGSVVLVITGGEALYADMGHFGREPIRWAWFLVALPALVLNYFGQGALLLATPDAISNPFYLLAPKWALAPMVILSTLATVIASQALVSGIFSITRQAVQLGFCPRLSTVHTSSREIGQIYVPFVNWTLFLGVIWLVLTFKSSSNLAAAYGIAVTGTMVITTLLAYEVAVRRWEWGLGRALLIFGAFFIFDAAFFGANVMKLTHGGWVPLLMAAVIYLLMVTWHRGRQILYARLKERSVSIESFCQ
ncbi:MAG: potassium transporter Kup, partial [Pseudobdellovibrionaceae bacterium]